MKTLLLFVMAASAFSQQFYHSMSVEAIPPDPPFEMISATPDELSGEWAIVNAYSGLALGHQEGRGGFRYASQGNPGESVLWHFTATPEGHYRIESDSGALQELPVQGAMKGERWSHVSIVNSGSAWDVLAVSGADTFVIRSVRTASILQSGGWNQRPGSWVIAVDTQDAGSHQEWRLMRAAPSAILKQDRHMYVRQEKSVWTIPTIEISTQPKVSWARDGDAYVYRVSVDDPEISGFGLNYGSLDGLPESTTEIHGQPGWKFSLLGWFARKGVKTGITGDFSLRTKYAPGPVMLSARSSERIPSSPSDATRLTHNTAMSTFGNTETSYWVIGPAFPPDMTAEIFHEKIEKLFLRGLAFLHPLLGPGDLQQSLRLLKPKTDFERLIVETLKPQLENLQ